MLYGNIGRVLPYGFGNFREYFMDVGASSGSSQKGPPVKYLSEISTIHHLNVTSAQITIQQHHLKLYLPATYSVNL
jgi:hypothetical protein